MRRSTENYYAFLLRDEPAGEKKKRLADRSFRELWERFREGGRPKEPPVPNAWKAALLWATAKRERSGYENDKRL